MTFFLVSLLLALMAQQPPPAAAPAAPPSPANERYPPPASGFSGEVTPRLGGPDDAPLEKLIFFGDPVAGAVQAPQVRVDVVAGRFVSLEPMPPGLRSVATVPPCIPLESLVLTVPEGASDAEKQLLGTAFFASWKPRRVTIGIPGFISIIFEPDRPTPPQPSPPEGAGPGASVSPAPAAAGGTTPPANPVPPQTASIELPPRDPNDGRLIFVPSEPQPTIITSSPDRMMGGVNVGCTQEGAR